MLERFLLIRFTRFVKKALHSKELNHKKFWKNGGHFLLFLADLFAFINSVWTMQRLIFWSQFCKNLSNTPGVKVLKYLKVFHIQESPWKTLLMRNLAYRNTFSNYAFAASPVFEHNGGNVPIQFFGKPFTIVSNETRHCLHGPTKVRIPFENSLKYNETYQQYSIFA